MPRKQTRIPDEENTLLANVLEYAQLRHVKAMHQRPAYTANGPGRVPPSRATRAFST
jgi:hypothetical protein